MKSNLKVKILSTVLALFMLIPTLCGCGNNGKNAVNTDTTDSKAAETTADTVSETETGGETTAEDQNSFGDTPVKASLPDKAGLTDMGDGLYKVNELSPESLGDLCGVKGKNLLFMTVMGEADEGKYTYRMTVYSLETYAVTARNEITAYAPEIGYLSDGRIYAIAREEGYVRIFDENLRPQKDIETTADILALSFDADYVVLNDNGKIKVKSISTATVTELLLTDKNESAEGTVFSLDVGRKTYMGVADTKNKTYTLTEAADGGLITESAEVVLSEKYVSLRSAFYTDRTYIYSFENAEYPCYGASLGGHIIFFSSDDGYTFYAVNTSNGEVSQISIEGYYCGAYISSDGFALTVFYNDDGEDGAVYIWDYLSDGAKKCDAEAVLYDAEGIDGVNRAVAAEIKSKTGVAVYYGNEGNDYYDNGFVCKRVTDSMKNYEMLKRLEALLEKFPAEMFGEACVDGVDRLEIYLCGAFFRTTTSSISSAAAVTSFSDGAGFITIDITCEGFETNICHELMHIFERRMNYAAATSSSTEFIAVWENMSPKNSYFWAYTDDDGNDIYYSSGSNKYTVTEKKKDNVYFLDAYSRTFPNEDRARIFEHLCNDTEEESNILKYEHLNEKALYLAAMLRYSFPCLTDAPVGELFWESMLGAVSLSDYAIFTETAPLAETAEETTL